MPYNFIPDSFHTDVTAEVLGVKIDQKSAISLQHGHFYPKFQVQGVAPTNNFLRLVRLQFCCWQFSYKKLCSSSKRSAILHENRPFCVFGTPFGGLRGNVRRSF